MMTKEVRQRLDGLDESWLRLTRKLRETSEYIPRRGRWSIYRLSAQEVYNRFEELYDFLGVERNTTPSLTKRQKKNAPPKP